MENCKYLKSATTYYAFSIYLQFLDIISWILYDFMLFNPLLNLLHDQSNLKSPRFPAHKTQHNQLLWFAPKNGKTTSCISTILPISRSTHHWRRGATRPAIRRAGSKRSATARAVLCCICDPGQLG
jgi:hypothetical protein